MPAFAASRPFPSIPFATTPQRLLAAHNLERAMARVPPMRWSSGLAAQATAYARLLAATGMFQHSNRGSRGGVGENLWMGTSGAFSIEQMIGGWTSERRMFVPGTFPYVSRTRSWHDVGHYTQMIWPTTTAVGCGIASARGNDVLVCRYGPAGNVMGLPVGGWRYAAR
jgi:Cysteine-rich secretory protein family